MNNFQIKLKILREQKGLSQYDLAKVFNISQSAIGNWEAGKREPDFTMVQKIADYFNVSVDYILGRTEEKEMFVKSLEDKKNPPVIPEGYGDLYLDFQDNLTKKERASKIASLSPEQQELLFKTIDSIIDTLKK